MSLTALALVLAAALPHAVWNVVATKKGGSGLLLGVTARSLAPG